MNIIRLTRDAVHTTPLQKKKVIFLAINDIPEISKGEHESN
jgi:hypothetical protein